MWRWTDCGPHNMSDTWTTHTLRHMLRNHWGFNQFTLLLWNVSAALIPQELDRHWAVWLSTAKNNDFSHENSFYPILWAATIEKCKLSKHNQIKSSFIRQHICSITKHEIETSHEISNTSQLPLWPLPTLFSPAFLSLRLTPSSTLKLYLSFSEQQLSMCSRQ